MFQFLLTAGEEVQKRRKEMILEREKSPLAEKETKPAVPVIEINSDETFDEEEEQEEEEEDEDLLSELSDSEWRAMYDEDDYSDSDEHYANRYDNYNGLPGAYYGGYGSCYSCGEHGHWSNGCPYNPRRRRT